MRGKWTVSKQKDRWTVLTPSGITRAFHSWVGAWAYVWVRAELLQSIPREIS